MVESSDLIVQIVNMPYVWIIVILVIVLLIVRTMVGNKQLQETRPFYGMEVREKMTDKKLSKRNKVWGQDSDYDIVRGFVRVGKTKYIEPIIKPKYDIKTGRVVMDKATKEPVKENIYCISFRQHGFIAWLKAKLFKKYEHMLIDPKAVTFDRKDKKLVINPLLYLIEDSGVWTVATNKETGIIEDLNIKADVENVKGFTSDFLRRLSNEHPAQALFTERLSHASDLEEKKKKSSISRWVGN